MVAFTEAPAFPSRHREAEARGLRLGLPLRLATRLGAPDDAWLLDRLGQGLREQDEAGAAVAQAIRTRAISHRDLATALSEGVTEATPPVLREFLELVTDTPEWVDWDLVEEGARVGSRLGRTAGDVLLGLSLVGGFRFGGPAELLVATNALGGPDTLQRLAETQHWTLGLLTPGALRPGESGWRTTVHVRVMHALVNSAYADKWDIERWGLPINQSDQAGTLGLFDGALLAGARGLGARISRTDAHAVMHMWRYVGWLLGVDDDFLTDDERERHRINLHILRTAPAQTQAGAHLAQSVLKAIGQRDFPGSSPFTRGLRRWYDRERVLSLWTALLGPRSMLDLGLPMRPPWAVGVAILLNTVKHRVIALTPGGKRWLENHGHEQQVRIQSQYLRGTEGAVAKLPT